MRTFEVAVPFFVFFAVVFAAFFFWTRLARHSSERDVDTDVSRDSWRQGLVGSILACLLFVVCFAIGVWFSISRLKGGGWFLSA